MNTDNSLEFSRLREQITSLEMERDRLRKIINQHHVRTHSGGPDGPIEFCANNCWVCAALEAERDELKRRLEDIM